MRWVLMVAVALGVAGCDTGQIDANRCQSYGYRPDTDAFASCMMQAHQERMRMIGNIQFPQTQFVPMQVRQPVRTNCYRVGDSVSCTSN